MLIDLLSRMSAVTCSRTMKRSVQLLLHLFYGHPSGAAAALHTTSVVQYLTAFGHLLLGPSRTSPGAQVSGFEAQRQVRHPIASWYHASLVLRVISKVAMSNRRPLQTCCRLPPELILDRVAMLNRVEPDKSKQVALYDDTVHFFSPEPYHAFNWELLSQLPENVPSHAEHPPTSTFSRASFHEESQPMQYMGPTQSMASEAGDSHMHKFAPVRFSNIPSLAPRLGEGFPPQLQQA
jgi:hypothetical protein